MKKARVLVIDDERSIRELLKYLFEIEGHEVYLAADATKALDILAEQNFDVVIQDMMLPDMSGVELLEIIKKKDPFAIVVVITAITKWQTAVEAMRIGAFDYVRKPFDNDNIRAVIARAIKYKTILESLPETGSDSVKNIIGNSKKIQEIQRAIRRISPTDATVIIYGESGTGKELAARSVHLNSLRRANVFIPVNCGALSETLLESELFGHVKGAFTNAIANKKGLFEIAHSGTLFLDEIGEMSLQTQVKLLRVLEERVFIPLGGTNPIQVDVRFIAATNRNLEEMVQKGEFREDLYYRLNVIPLYLPTLRERKDDIPLLAGHFLALYASRFHKHVTSFSESAMKLFLEYEWPGNIRELSNIIQRAAVLSETEVIDKGDIIGYVRSVQTEYSEFIVELTEEGIDLEAKLEEFEKYYICEALKKTEGNLTNAAKLLALSFRSIRYKVKKYKIDIKDFSSK